MIEAFWKEFLQAHNLPETTEYLEVFHFELNERLANALLDLVLKGQKKATASALYAFEITGDRLPEVGDYSIVTNWDGVPKCVIQATNVTIIPYKDITYDICKREGEDDNLESWQRGHQRFFEEEGKQLGYSFSEDLPVVFEDFNVVYQQ